MKKLKYLVISLSFAIIFFGVGCDSILDLDMQPIDQLSEDAVFNDVQLTTAFLNDLYDRGLGDGFQTHNLAGFTDEAHFTHGRQTSTINRSQVTPSNLGAWDDTRINFYRWSGVYSNIRNVNIFLSNIQDSAIKDRAVVDRMTGEAHYLRAWFYFILLRQWGGVPIIDGVFGLEDDLENLSVERNTFSETVDFILQEIELAIDLLPLQHSGSNIGRAHASAAMALKSRVLLYAASDLFHNTSEWAGGFSNPELIGYTNTNQDALWQSAREAAQDVIDLGIYDLYKANPAPGDSTAVNFGEIFLINQHEEAIFSKFFNSNTEFLGGWEAHFGRTNGPNGYRMWGGNAPLQNLVDDFEMKDGTEFDWSNPTHAEAPYENRDPRFYATIMYDGAEWSERLPGTAQDIDPFGVIQKYSVYNVIDDNGNVISSRGGLDTRQGPIEDWNGTFTGYNVRKYIDPDVVHVFERQEVPWHYFRFAEILLNYAEASIELGMEQDARNAINQIRHRVNMPEINDSGEALMNRYRNERRIELAFEHHRYFDVRRWMIAPQVLDRDAYGINLEAEITEETLEEEGILGYHYTKIEVLSVEERSWDDKMYLLPIPREEMNRNNRLVQNPNF